jgi:Rhodopirellula transposase DDE domain
VEIRQRGLSQITRNSRGRPLTSHETIVNLIGAATTTTGLTVTAQLDTAPYPTGVKVSDRQMKTSRPPAIPGMANGTTPSARIQSWREG